MTDPFDNLNLGDLIELQSISDILIRQSMAQTRDDWLVELNREIGIETLFKWSSLIVQAIGKDFRSPVFNDKAHQLSSKIQMKFIQDGLEKIYWAPVIFYLGMFFTYTDEIGIARICHSTSNERIMVLSRLDTQLKEAISLDPVSQILFINSKYEDPIPVLYYLIDCELIDIVRIDIFKTTINLPPSMPGKMDISLHQQLVVKSNEVDGVTYIYY